MAKKIADLLVVISGDSENLRKELNAIKRQINSAFGGKAMDLSEKVAGSFKYLAAGAVALGVAAVKMNADMAMTARAFEVLTGDADKAKAHLDQLEAFAASTPFEFPGLVEASKKLQAYGFETEAVIPIIQAVGDAAMAVGMGQEGIDRITLALGQMNAKGKVSAEEMRQLAETGLPAWDMLAQGIGVTVPQAMEMAKKGAIDAKAGISAVLTGLDSRFNGMMNKVAGEIPQSFSNMQDSVKSIMRTLGADLTETFDLKTKMKGAADWLSEFATLAKTSGIREALDQMIPENLRALIVGISAAIVGVAVPAFALMAVNVIAATWPLLAIGAAFALVAVIIYKNWDAIGPFWTGLWNGIVGTTKWAWDILSGIFNGIIDAASWVINKLRAFANTVKSLAGIEVSVGAEPTAKPEEGTKNVKKGILSLNEALGTLKSGADSTETATSGAAKRAARSAASSVNTQKSAYDELAEKAKSTSERIENEWIRLTGTQMDVLEKWRQDETKTLEESAAANENYERDKQRLSETYAEKRRKILNEEDRERARTLKQITDDYHKMYARLSEDALSGSAKDLFAMSDKAKQDMKGVSDFFAGMAADFAQGTKQQKQNIIDALDSIQAKYKIIGDAITFEEEEEKYALERYKQLQDERVSYFRQCQDIKADIEEAYNDSSLARLREVLNKENVMRIENLNAQKRIMDLYQDVTIGAHVSAAEQTANVLDSSRDSFKSFFSDILTGAKDFGDALKDLVSDIWGNIVDQLAEKWSNQIVESLFGGLFGGNEGGGMLGGIFGSLFGGGGNGAAENNPIAAVTESFSALTETSNGLGDSMSGFGGIVGAGSALMKAYNAIQTGLNVATKPAETTTTVAATTALGAFTVAVGAATAALQAMAFMSFIPGLASGGAVFGPGSGTSDSIPAMLSNGEYVISAAAVRKLGLPLLDRLNNGNAPGYAEGGLISGSAFRRIETAVVTHGTAVNENIDSTTVNIYGDINSASEEESIFGRLFRDTRFALMGA